MICIVLVPNDPRLLTTHYRVFTIPYAPSPNSLPGWFWCVNNHPIRTDQGKTTMRTRLFAQFVWHTVVIVATVFMVPSSNAHGQTNQPSQVPKANLASAAEVSVSSEQKGFPKAHAIDGNRWTEWASTGGHPWIALQWKETLFRFTGSLPRPLAG